MMDSLWHTIAEWILDLGVVAVVTAFVLALINFFQQLAKWAGWED